MCYEVLPFVCTNGEENTRVFLCLYMVHIREMPVTVSPQMRMRGERRQWGTSGVRETSSI